MTLCLPHDGNLSQLREVLRNGLHIAFAAANGANGVLLRSVSFLRSSTSRDAPENHIQECAIHDWEQHDDMVAGRFRLSHGRCGTLVIEYRATGSVRLGHTEDGSSPALVAEYSLRHSR